MASGNEPEGGDPGNGGGPNPNPDNVGNGGGDGETIFIDPAAKTSGNGGPSSGGRRGRPRGSKNRTSQTASQVDWLEAIQGLEQLLLTIHLGIATLLSAPVWALDPKEAKQMADALGRVARHYPNAASRIGAKGIDMANLMTVFVGIYGTRVMLWKMEKDNKPSPQPAQADNVESLGPRRPFFGR